MHRVDDAQAWPAALADAFSFDDCVLAERYIEGRELTVAILDGAPLPVVEIIAPDTWYDYRSKYTSGITQYRVPAELEAATQAALVSYAQQAYDVLACRGFARVDFRVNAAGDLYILELNSIPGFTETSLLPKAAAQAGIPFAELCDRIMAGAAC